MKLLDNGSNGVRFVGIHGIGGIGKATLAKVIFNKLSLKAAVSLKLFENPTNATVLYICRNNYYQVFSTLALLTKLIMLTMGSK